MKYNKNYDSFTIQQSLNQHVNKVSNLYLKTYSYIIVSDDFRADVILDKLDSISLEIRKLLDKVVPNTHGDEKQSKNNFCYYYQYGRCKFSSQDCKRRHEYCDFPCKFIKY